jgi:hypothetical protein
MPDETDELIDAVLREERTRCKPHEHRHTNSGEGERATSMKLKQL